MSGLTPDSPYLGLVSNIQLRPVFVLGLNRSGTSLLYHLLHQAGCFNVVAAFDLVHRDRLLYLHLHPDELESCRLSLRNWFQKRNLKDRGYDRIPVGSDLPEEYGYALDAFSLTPRLTRRNIEQFRTFARKVQFVGKPEQPLLLKNPWDTNNFLEIRRMFPQARFLFIHRHPIPVLSSQLKMFGGLLRRPSEYDMLIEESYRRFCESRVLRSIIRAIFSDSLPHSLLETLSECG